MRARGCLLSLCIFGAVSCGDKANRASVPDPAPPAARRARPTGAMALKNYQTLVDRLNASGRKKVDLSRLFQGRVKKIPKACGAKSAKVTVYPMPKTLHAAAKKQPGALLLVRPDYIACTETSSEDEPVVCSLGVAPGKGGAPQLRLSVVSLDLEETVIDKVLGVSWKERPAGQVMATLRLKASKPTCQGADSEVVVSTDVSFLRYHQGGFSSLLTLEAEGLVQNRGKRFFTATKWSWEVVHISMEKHIEVLATAHSRDGAPTRCSQSVTLYKFNAKKDKLLEVTGAEHKNFLKEGNLLDYSEPAEGECP